MDQVVRITQHLDDIDPVEKTDIAAALNTLAARIGRREIVIVFSDFFGADLDDQLLAQTEDLRQGYLRALDRFRSGLMEVALRNRCEYVEADTSCGMRELFVDYLRQRSIGQRGRSL